MSKLLNLAKTFPFFTFMLLLAIFTAVKNLIFSIQGGYFGRAVSYLFEGGEAFSEATMKSIGTIIEQSISRGHLGAAIFIAVAPVLIFPVLHFIVKKIIKATPVQAIAK